MRCRFSRRLRSMSLISIVDIRSSASASAASAPASSCPVLRKSSWTWPCTSMKTRRRPESVTWSPPGDCAASSSQRMGSEPSLATHGCCLPRLSSMNSRAQPGASVGVSERGTGILACQPLSLSKSRRKVGTPCSPSSSFALSLNSTSLLTLRLEGARSWWAMSISMTSTAMSPFCGLRSYLAHTPVSSLLYGERTHHAVVPDSLRVASWLMSAKGSYSSSSSSQLAFATGTAILMEFGSHLS
mmetsp:Transcript_29558/g.84920  ORF Transcript_29558/g.84920 Transcript_29558/m.84920 type:complete len:243 (+) Transcript_29558:373-1101(+)